MNRYQFVKQLGDGTYGSVVLASTVESGEKVAIKKMKKKYYSWDECLNLREVKSLRKLNHANIVKLKEVIRENDMLYFVFEFMKENLYQMTKDRDKLFPESSVRNIIYQVLQGLAFMHKHGFFHRDLKPENLLCSGPDFVKIADFGLAREIRSRPPYTDYVSTRWYRAPEVLLRSTNYNSPIDMWALGTIMAEVYSLRPLFPGSSEIDQLFKCCSVLGTPTKMEWPEGHKLAAAMNFKWPQMVATPLKQLIPSAGADGLQLMQDMLSWDPQKRPTAQQALRHNFFKVGQNLGMKPLTTPRANNLTTPQQGIISTQPTPQNNMQQNSQQPRQNGIYNQPIMRRPSVVGQKPQPAYNPSVLEQENKAPVLPSIKKDPLAQTQAKKSGRKRWNVGATNDSTDDFLDEFDLGTSFSKKPSPIKAPVKRRDSFLDDDDFFGNSFAQKAPAHLPKVVANNNRINSGRSSASSAKQLYMSKSRYMPGKNPVSRGQKDSPSSNWSNSINKPMGYNFNRNNNPIGGPPSYNTSTTGYVPSFAGSATTNQTNYRAGGWKRAEPAPLAFNNKSSANRQMVGATGRTDWAAKYLK